MRTKMRSIGISFATTWLPCHRPVKMAAGQKLVDNRDEA